MKILLLDADEGRRDRIRFSLELTGKPFSLREMASLEPLEVASDLDAYRLAIVGPSLPVDPLVALVYLRGRMSSGNVVAYGEFDLYDKASPRRLKEAGADLVFDGRVSAAKISILLNPFVWRTADPGGADSGPNWAIRQAMQSVAPMAVSD